MIVSKIKNILAVISGFALLVFIYKLFSSNANSKAFPKAAEKAAAEKEVSQLKEEIEKLGQKEYSDADIEKKFNQ